MHYFVKLHSCLFLGLQSRSAPPTRKVTPPPTKFRSARPTKVQTGKPRAKKSTKKPVKKPTRKLEGEEEESVVELGDAADIEVVKETQVVEAVVDESVTRSK